MNITELYAERHMSSGIERKTEYLSRNYSVRGWCAGSGGEEDREGVVAAFPSGVRDRADGGIGSSGVLGTEAAGDRAMDDAGAEAAFAGIIGERDGGIIEAGQQPRAMDTEARLKVCAPTGRKRLGEEAIGGAMDGRDRCVEIWRGQGGLLALVAEANNPAQELMHGTGPLARDRLLPGAHTPSPGAGEPDRSGNGRRAPPVAVSTGH